MSWGLGWKRSSEIFHLTLVYGDNDNDSNSNNAGETTPRSSSVSSASSSVSAAGSFQYEPGLRVELDWSAGDDEDQIALRLQSQLMVALPPPQDSVVVEINHKVNDSGDDDGEDNVGVDMKVVRRREPLRLIILSKTVGSGQQSDGVGVLTRLIRSNLEGSPGIDDGALGFSEHWKSVTCLSISGCSLSVLPVELTRLPLLERLYLDNNKLTHLPPELGELRTLKVLTVDYNMLASVPAVELRQCVGLVELSLEHNKLVRPLLDFRAMSELCILRLFGNPLEFLPEILPLHKLRHLSLANIRIEGNDSLKSVQVQIEMENGSYFIASRHKLSAFFSLIFRFSSCHHPLLASALAKIMQDHGNRIVVGKDENAVRQLISMMSSDNQHVIEQASSALSALAADVSVAMQLMKSDIMRPIQSLLRSVAPEELKSVLQVVVNLAFASDAVAQKILTKDVLRSLKVLCAHRDSEVQRLALLAVGNLGFCIENRRTLVTSESLRELLLRLMVASDQRVYKAAARALAILGENENLRRALRGRPIPKQGLRILAMDGGGMKGLATVQMLKQIEQGTGKRIHEMFDLICGTSTGGMLAVALGIKQMSLDECEEIYKKLGKLVFAEPTPKDNEAATWREKLDQLYKSSSQSFRVVVHGSKHSADQFERLLKEMCADEEGDLLIESAVKSIPKVFVVATLVSVAPAQPFLFRNYQYPAGIQERPLGTTEITSGSAVGTDGTGTQAGSKHCAFIGSCKHHIWQAIRASSAAPYYLDDFSDDVNRWQDGAIVANNPAIFAIREAQLLWPDAKIDCLVSIGCGSVPTKVRKGGWRYLDTGQVLIESACSTERVEEALNALLPLLPEIQYFRFEPVDERCDMELDETDPAIWLKLEGATQEYMEENSEAFKNVCDRLLLLHEEKSSDKMNSPYGRKTTLSNTVIDENSPSLGWRRMVLLVEASHSPDSGRAIYHARSLETFSARTGIRLSSINRILGFSKSAPATTFATPFASPLLTGSFPSSPLLYSPEVASQRVNRIDLVPPLSLDECQTGKSPGSPPKSPMRPRELSAPVQSLQEKLQSSPQVGIIHLALQNDAVGSILSWQNDVFVVAEPGELADRFLRSVKLSFMSMVKGRNRKETTALSKISSVADLIAYKPNFQIGCVVHRYIGRQTQVMEDDQEIGAYMFRRTVPSIHLSPDDVRWMIGAWRDRIIICSGAFGPTPSLVKAFLDSGAKAVICPSTKPPETESAPFHGSVEFNTLDNGRFEIGDEETEEEDMQQQAQQPPSPVSDWEDSDPDKAQELVDDEEELSRFICLLYDTLFREGARVDVALQHALASHPNLRFSCHLPSIP
ncbi:phospholipase A I-like isoform X3 [Papaver somniferum]|uniref:phospholipase A I-like isoform X3 n=1 Tax=Papaver somniferum TaxID=3469 RepID=UPI000E6F84DA|nr:phospholipase A I-like isoform X3 [Papaver somniferum]